MTTSTEQPRGKYSVTLSSANAERAKQNVGPQGFSAYLDKALQNQLVADGMAEYARIRALDPAEDLFEASEADAA